MRAVFREFRLAIRTLRRRPTFFTIAALTLAIGIAATTTIYSVVNGVLLEPLPYADSGRLAIIYRTFPGWREQEALRARWDRIWFSYPVYLDWSSRQGSFESVGAWAQASRTLGGLEAAEQVSIARATASLLPTLGVRPALGRYFLPGEDQPPGAAVAVISHEMWTTRFGESRGVIGRAIRLDDRTYEIVGVLPEGLDLGNRGRPQPIWIPAGGDPEDARPGNTAYLAVGRLRAGLTLERATDETRRLVAASSPPDPVGAHLEIWRDDVTRTARRPLLMLLGAAAVLLALACVNVATLLLGEAAGRIEEFATRAALGAGRARLTAQLLAESVVLAVAGVAGGVLLADVALRTLLAVVPATVPRLSTVALDARVLTVASAAGIITALAFGLAPSLSLATASPRELSGAAARRVTRCGEGWTTRVLVATQVALSCVLLVGAALLGRSLWRVSAVDPGFPATGLVLIGLGTPGGRAAATPDATTTLHAEVADRLAALPGVDRVAVGSAAPFSGGGSSSAVVIEGRPLPPGVTGIEARRSHVLPGFTETLGIRLLAGRNIDGGDRAGAPLVTLVNETMARRFWPGESAIGKRVRLGDDWLTVVGVVSDVKHTSLGDATRITLYLPARQQPTPYLVLIARTQLTTAAFSDAVRRTVASVDPSVPVTRVDAMSDLVRRSFASERFRAMLVSVFAVVAAVLATAGSYGVTSRAVARQRREIGIRMALGAPEWRVVVLFVQRTGVAAVTGAVLGLASAAAGARWLAPYLFDTRVGEPSVYALSAAVLVAAALLASLVPATRAAHADPVAVLRE